MKTVMIWFVSVLMSGSFALAQAQESPYYEQKTFLMAMYPALEPAKLWLNIERTTRLGQVRVEMCDRQGRVLFSEWLPKRDMKFHQGFDLSGIGDGTYTFIVTDGVQRQEQTFRLSSPGFEQQLPKRLITMNGAKPH